MTGTTRFLIVLSGSLFTAFSFWAGDIHFELGLLPQFPLLILMAALPGLWLSYRLTKGTSNEGNTFIYTLFHRNKVVYVGITYTYRLGSRIDEHRRSGKIFDRIDLSEPFSREDALNREAKKIRQLKPKYNVQHTA